MKSNKNKTIDEYEGLSYSEIQNKKLVNVLKHKIFKGFEITKNSKTFYRKRPKCLRIIDFEENNLETYDVNYDIQYKRQFLKKLYKPKFDNPFIIQNYSDKKVPSNLNKLDNKNIKKKNIFLTDPKSRKRKFISAKEIDKNNKIINDIFPNKEEAKLYSNIPLLYVERSISKPKSSKEKIILSEGKEYGEYDGLTENQFIYKISHNTIPINSDIYSFQGSPRIRKGYIGRNIKSATQREFYKKIIDHENINSNLSKGNININNNNNPSNDIIKTFKNINKVLNNQKNYNTINNDKYSTINYQNNNSTINYLNNNSTINYLNNKSFKEITNKSSVGNYNNDNDLGIQVTISSLKMDKRSENDSKKNNLIDNKKSRNIKKGKNNIFQNSFIKREFPINISNFYSVCPSYDDKHILFNKNDYRKKELKYLNEFKTKTNERVVTNQLLIDENYFKKYYNNYLKNITTGTIE